MLLLLGGQETANSIPNSEFLFQMNDKVFYYKFGHGNLYFSVDLMR